MKILIQIILSLMLITNAEASMKILKVENGSIENTIEVTIEGYPHAQPVFPATTTKEDLPDLLRAWKVNQDAVDEINSNPPEKPTPPDISELKELEGEEI